MNIFEQMGFKMGLKKSPYDHRDHLHMIPMNFPELPNKVNLKDKIKTVFKQSYNDCSSNFICNNVMSLKDDNKEVSRLFQYYNSRFVASSDFITDDGATYRDALKALQKFGFVNVEEWEYTDEDINEPPNVDVYREGIQNCYFIKSYRKLYPTLNSIKYTLFCGHLIMFGIAIYDNFLDLDETFIVPMPNKTKNIFQGLHAVLMCGYDNDLQTCLCVNSWGRLFGDKGFLYLPYDFILDEQLALDFWIIDTKIQSI